MNFWDCYLRRVSQPLVSKTSSSVPYITNVDAMDLVDLLTNISYNFESWGVDVRAKSGSLTSMEKNTTGREIHSALQKNRLQA